MLHHKRSVHRHQEEESESSDTEHSLYPPQNEVLGGYTVFSLSAIPSFCQSVIPSFRDHFFKGFAL